MACKKCSAKHVDDQFKCRGCIVKDKEFYWLVITKAKKCDGNMYDEIGFSSEAMDEGRKVETLTLVQNFYVGELLAIDPDFEREVNGRGRKPCKWDVEYKMFPAKDYLKALQLAVSLSFK